MNRRESIGLTLGASAALAIKPQLVLGAESQLIHRRIPASGEKVPVIGLGSSATFRQAAAGEDVGALREVLQAMVKGGASVFDTAPAYGDSEEVAGRIARELGITEKIFWATKVNVAKGGRADPAAARAQIELSFKKFGVPVIDLIQVHSLADTATHLRVLNELKDQKRIRYVGVTTTNADQYGELEAVMRNQPLDFIGVDYAIDNRAIEARILPLATQRKIGVLVYLPFGRTRLFKRVGERAVPGWAREFGANTWAQFFLKYVVGHPAVTAVTPATSKAAHMRDNIAAGMGAVPDEAARRRMVELIESLPA
jgi:aryl-alcohol dehydrogenase-like predicted oxidoreductase